MVNMCVVCAGARFVCLHYQRYRNNQLETIDGVDGGYFFFYRNNQLETIDGVDGGESCRANSQTHA
jgi:hypothetical protein